jgi:rhodanese-related sulfurtransferase
MKKVLFLMLFMLIMSVGYASADEYKTISAEELKQMMDAKKQVVIVDARTEQEYRDGHVPTAINVPPEKINSIGTLLPKDKKVLIVFYCRGIG